MPHTEVTYYMDATEPTKASRLVTVLIDNESKAQMGTPHVCTPSYSITPGTFSKFCISKCAPINTQHTHIQVHTVIEGELNIIYNFTFS